MNVQLLDRIVPAMEDAPAELQRRAADILRRGGIATGSQVRYHVSDSIWVKTTGWSKFEHTGLHIRNA